ncbi:MAG TPA: tyrosine--tRNA ligase [Gemmataceae bacterium]|nr:tyrosine--tRNA ligase [Gemmataceae bacterium]
MKSVAEQLGVIRRGTEQIEPFEELQRKLERSLQTKKPLRVKYGIDPTAADVHLGHTVPLRKMRLFQELGHQAVLIIGNYTALVGDPSGRDQTRAKLTQELVEANAQEYLQQVSKIIDISKTEVHRNGDWFSHYSFLQVMELCGKITVQRMMERDDFTKRLSKGEPISLHECLYPLMQGQDSVEIHADIELGGSEQLFNLMRGRHLQQDAGQEPQVCITLPILRGLDGEKRMGKSLKNYIGVGEPAREQFGKTMRIPDELLKEWFELLTDRSEADIARFLDPDQTTPFEAKKILAGDIVTFYHGAEAAKVARADWEKQFSEKQDPDHIPEAKIEGARLAEGKMNICPLLVTAGLAPSNKEARRKIGEGAVHIGPDRRKITDPNEAVAVESGLVLRLGRKIVRVTIS